MSTDNIKVRIQCTGTWTYDQEVDIPKADFLKITSLLNGKTMSGWKSADRRVAKLVVVNDIDIDMQQVEVDAFDRVFELNA